MVTGDEAVSIAAKSSCSSTGMIGGKRSAGWDKTKEEPNGDQVCLIDGQTTARAAAVMTTHLDLPRKLKPKRNLQPWEEWLGFNRRQLYVTNERSGRTLAIGILSPPFRKSRLLVTSRR
jgi:hypothetical protein